MRGIKDNKGITLVTLVITIIVIVLIAGVTTYSGIDASKKARENKFKIELSIVQHAIEEVYYKYTISENENIFIGRKLTDLSEISTDIRQQLISNTVGDYYELSQVQLKSIGVNNAEDTYIVNYKTGEVINKTQGLYLEGVIKSSLNSDGKDH